MVDLFSFSGMLYIIHVYGLIYLLWLDEIATNTRFV